MATQVNNGAGFEYCCASALMRRYEQDGRQLSIEQPSIAGFEQRRDRFGEVKDEIKGQQIKAARAVAHHIVTSNQSWAKGIFDQKRSYKLRVGDDARNMDVRDLLIYSDRGNELGISLKWNSDEIKSLRLGDSWFRQFNIPDNGEWERAVQHHHAQLARYTYWRDAVAEMGLNGVYSTYRDAVVSKIQQGMGQDGFIELFSQFLFGRQNYLKVMAIAKGREISLAYYDSKNLPTRVIEAYPSERGLHYFEVSFDRGWHLLFRLHNKDSSIKPTAIGSGMSLTITVTGWGEKSGHQHWEVPNA